MKTAGNIRVLWSLGWQPASIIGFTPCFLLHACFTCVALAYLSQFGCPNIRNLLLQAKMGKSSWTALFDRLLASEVVGIFEMTHSSVRYADWVSVGNVWLPSAVYSAVALVSSSVNRLTFTYCNYLRAPLETMATLRPTLKTTNYWQLTTDYYSKKAY